MSHPSPLPSSPTLPCSPVDRVVAPIARFLHVEAAGGAVLLVATVVALALANSPWADRFLAIWNTPVSLHVGSVRVVHTLREWINDGLMTVFFFVIGLEIKLELVQGELRTARQAALPVLAALGGMVVPAGIYLVLQHGQPGSRGWGIPMATDIAFVVGAMALFGSRVPRGLRVMILSLAIVDDIGAILVIAIGYSAQVNFLALALAAGGIAGVLVMQRIGVRSIPLYWVAGIATWAAVHASGVHATLAGVVLGLLTPTRSWVGVGLLGQMVQKAEEFLSGEAPATNRERMAILARVQAAATEALSPLDRLQSTLHPWVSFVIMPVFALANAGVALRVPDLGSPVAIAIAAALVLGKPMGILVFAWLGVLLGACRLPDGVGWGAILAGGALSGIGFTMSIFIAGLALPEPMLSQSKVGILAASVIAASVGMALLAAMTKPESATPATAQSGD